MIDHVQTCSRAARRDLSQLWRFNVRCTKLHKIPDYDALGSSGVDPEKEKQTQGVEFPISFLSRFESISSPLTREEKEEKLSGQEMARI